MSRVFDPKRTQPEEEKYNPKEMAITISTAAEPTRHKLTMLTLDLPKRKAIPNTGSKDTPKQSLIPLPNMARVKELQGAWNIKQGATRKPFLAHKSADTLFFQASRTAARKC